ncbi:ribosome-binding factor A [Candidatus Saccharibacteria bacterium]|nr:ribosome-binding factor A [Candidatus Saccharibacteria bacterium]MCB9834932.1 ribosome-binding factor A [Candidatus Nomurabacteria bacterium]
MSYRIEQINNTILELLGNKLKLLTSKSQVLITIQEVSVSPDLSNCRVYLAFFPEPSQKQVNQFINSTRVELQKTLAKGLSLRKTPRLQLIYDSRPDQVSRIEKILNDYKS